MTREEIKQLFTEGIDCSQVVAGAFSDALHIDQADLRKVSACFGGGMMCGETCGAITGALMVIGIRYGHSENGDTAGKKIMQEKVMEFKSLFAEKYPSAMCRELLGHDISKPGEMDKVMEKGLMFSLCPCIVEDVIDILGKIL